MAPKASKATEKATLPGFSADVPSQLDEKDMLRIKRQYDIRDGIKLVAAKLGERVSHCMTFRLGLHEECLRAGIRFPFQGMVESTLRAFEVAPSQLVPNTWRMLFALDIWAQENNVHPTGRVLGQILIMVKLGQFLSLKAKGRKVVDGLPTSTKFWKPGFFFAFRESAEGGTFGRWNVPEAWCDMEELKSPPAPFPRAEKEALEKLEARQKEGPIIYEDPAKVFTRFRVKEIGAALDEDSEASETGAITAIPMLVRAPTMEAETGASTKKRKAAASEVEKKKKKKKEAISCPLRGGGSAEYTTGGGCGHRGGHQAICVG